MARRPVKTRPDAPRERNLWMLAVPAAVLWLVVFGIVSFTTPLQNNGSLDRLTVVLLAPEVSSLLGGNDSAGWKFLPQRADIVGVALLILAGSWGMGGLALRLLNARNPMALGKVERGICTFGLGLSLWSLTVLGLGLAGWLFQPLFIGLLVVSAAIESALQTWDWRGKRQESRADFEPAGGRELLLFSLAVAPFITLAALAAMLPPFDFDVKEYHLGGPKEWFLDGRVHFLPHNVYTSFPALTEMLSLSAMVVRGDWYRGALVGQLVLWFFLPLTAATVFAIGRRLFGTTAGLCGAAIYATTPWSYRIAVIAYAEGGLACFLALSFFAAVFAAERVRAGGSPSCVVFLAGLFAGSAMACKYPGVVQVVIPIGVALLAVAFMQRRAGGVSPPSVWRVGLLFSVGVLLAVGPWLAKNVIETGNPVYPLLWSVFDGTDWNAELDAKWKAAHSPAHYDPVSFVSETLNIAVRSDWQSLLVFGLAPLAFLDVRRRQASIACVYLAYLYAAWWLLTHRIDRFWVPLLPVACVMAGAGAAWAEDLPRRFAGADVGNVLRKSWRFAAGSIAVMAIAFNLVFVSTPLSGNPAYFGDLNSVAKTVATPSLAVLNDRLPPGSKVLLVGEAEIFDARFPLIYNTVFDQNLFEEWIASDGSDADRPLRSADQIRDTFREHGITHIFVNWREILRYRTTYGFTPFVVPERFETLRAEGLLGPPQTIHQSLFDSLGGAEQREAEERFGALLRGRKDERSIIAGELYPVLQHSQ